MRYEIKKGLLGIVVDETTVSQVVPEINSLTYRGYTVQDLCEKCVFEEVAYLVLNGDLPNKKDLKKFKSQLDTIIGKPSNFGQDNQQNLREKIEISTLTTVPKMRPGEQKSTKIDAMLEELKKDVITPPKHVITPPKHEDIQQRPIVKETREEIVQKPEIIISSTSTISKPETITTNEEVKPQPIQLPKDIEIDEKDDDDDDDLTKIKDKIMKTLESLDQTEVD